MSGHIQKGGYYTFRQQDLESDASKFDVIHLKHTSKYVAYIFLFCTTTKKYD